MWANCYALRDADLQRFEQYFTSSQTFSHFFRHEKGLSQTGQSLLGRSDLAILLPDLRGIWLIQGSKIAAGFALFYVGSLILDAAREI
jgi:hypothetical protein